MYKRFADPIRCLAAAMTFAACTWSTQPTTSPTSTPSSPRPATKAPAQQAVVADSGRAAPAPQPAGDWIEREGLSFWVKPRAVKVGNGWGVEIEVEVKATDGATHVVYGYSRGLALSGVRFGNMNGMQPFSEGGKVTRFGRARPGGTLTLQRAYPGNAHAAGWTPLKPGDSIVVSLKTWASKGSDPVANPAQVDIAGVTLTVDDAGKASVSVEKSKG